jgi:hypothetical protein
MKQTRRVHMIRNILWRVWSNAVVARQPQVKHFLGYAGLSNSNTWLHSNQEWETSTIRRTVYLLGQLGVVWRRQDTTGVRSVQCPQWVERDQVSYLRLPSNNCIRPNTSQYVRLYFHLLYVWGKQGTVGPSTFSKGMGTSSEIPCPKECFEVYLTAKIYGN